METSQNANNGPARWEWRPGMSSLLAVAMSVAIVMGMGAAVPPAEQKAPDDARAAVERVVADYVGLYTRPTLDQWKTLFHDSLVVAYPTKEGGIRTRGLEDFFKLQKDRFETGRKMSERLENVRIDQGRRMARVSADFVFVDQGKENRGRLGLHLVESRDGWKITAVVFSYDQA